MSKKQDKAIITGFAMAGALNVRFEIVGRHYRRAYMTIPGLGECQVRKIPGTSPLDPVAMKRKAKGLAGRFTRHQVTTLTW